MSQLTATDELVGRGARDGKSLFNEWYAELGEAASNERQAAYVFVMGSLCELLRTFDMPIVFPEINSLQTAVRKISDEYLSQAEDDGFSPDVCGYVKADYALQLRGGDHPMGRIPPPSIAVLTTACNTYIKWAEIWERMYDIPVCTIDVPSARSADGSREDLSRDRLYVEAQLREVIGQIETLTRQSFDVDRLRETMRLTNDMGRSWRRLLEINRASPAVFDAMLDGTIYLGVANALRGTEKGAAYFRDLVEEMEYKASQGISPAGAGDAEHRLIFVGVPCYPILRRFYELFFDWGGTFVSSTYMWFASGGLHRGFEYDLERPLESLAEGLLLGVRAATDAMMFQDRALVEAIDEYGADGVVYHPVKSCRTVSTSLADSRRVVLASRDVLCLHIESDMMDKRVVSEAQLKNRIDAFFEGLESRRLRMGRATNGTDATGTSAASALPAGPESGRPESSGPEGR